MKDDKITVIRNDLYASTWVIYLATWPVNGIGQRTARHRLDSAVRFNISLDWTFYVLCVKHMMCIRSTNQYGLWLQSQRCKQDWTMCNAWQ